MDPPFKKKKNMDPNASGSSSDGKTIDVKTLKHHTGEEKAHTNHHHHTGDGASPEYESFEAMNLKVELCSRLYSYGFKRPTKIQNRVLVPLLGGDNLLVLAKSEPEQVATYCSAILQLFNSNNSKDARTKFLILGCNTSISDVAVTLLSDLAANLPHLEVWDLYESKPVRRIPDVIVGTPRQVLRVMQNTNISFGEISFVVVDEADSHFYQVEVMPYIFGNLPETFRFVVFSEKWNGETMKITKVLLNRVKAASMVKFEVEKEPPTPLKDVTHYYAKTLKIYEEKMELLSSIFDDWCEDLKCVVFVDSTFWVNLIHSRIRDKAYVKAWGIRGNMDQEYRDRVLEDFQKGYINVLILTPYPSRGFDVKVPVIINFDMNLEDHVYEKRIAYFGTKEGCVINLTMPDDSFDLERIKAKYGVKFEVFPDNFRDVFSRLQLHLGRERNDSEMSDMNGIQVYESFFSLSDCHYKSFVSFLSDRLRVSFQFNQIGVHIAVKLETNVQKMQFLSLAFDNWHEDLKCVVFVKDYYWADHVLLQLRVKANVKAWGIRRKMDQEYRDRVVKDYRMGSINVLILTPHEACGFDVKAPLNINFDMCLELDECRSLEGYVVTTGNDVDYWCRWCALFTD